MIRKVYARGFNILGQCGLGNNLPFVDNKFVSVDIMPNNVDFIHATEGGTFFLANNRKTIWYTGYTYDIRSCIRNMIFFQNFKFLTHITKKIFPVFSTYPYYASKIADFDNTIIDFAVGGQFSIVLDDKHNAYSIGDNFNNQLGLDVLSSQVYKYSKVSLENNAKIVKIAAGYQHSLFLDSNNNLYSCGKKSRYQTGIEKFSNKESNSLLKVNLNDQFNNKILQDNEFIVDVSTGHYHSLILTNKGKVYSIGNNKFGQLGVSDNITHYSKHFIQLVFEKDNVFITSIKCGYYHNLFLDSEGFVYTNGCNLLGQINGVQDSIIEYVSSTNKLDFNEKAVKIYCSNYKNCVQLESGKHVFWGGRLYKKEYSLKNLPKIIGFNVYEKEEGLEGKKIIDVSLGLYHEMILVE